MKIAMTALSSSLLLASSGVFAQDAQQSASAATCTAEGLDTSLSNWRQRMRSAGSFRLAIDPDTSRGPTTAVLLESGKMRDASNPSNEPYFIGSIGDDKRTCNVRMSFTQCPAAQATVEKLKVSAVPLGFGLDGPAGAFVLHGPTYFVEFVDGLGNHNQWTFHGAGHPLQELVESSMAAMASCVQPAADAYRAGR